MNADYQILRIRMIEEAISRHYADRKMRTPVHLSIGQEAAAVGVCSALGPHDLVVSTHRSHAHYLAKGGSLNALIAELHGKATGCSGGFGGSMHLTDSTCGFIASTSIVGGTVPIGVGLAFAKRLRKEPGIVVVFHGDAAVEEGVFHEAANFASLHELPVLFVCENNGYSCYTPLIERQPSEEIAQRVGALHDIAWTIIDNKLDEIQDAVRTTAFPGIIEIRTKRNYEHCGPLKESEPEVLPCKPEWIDAIAEEIEAAFAAAEAAPWPEPRSLYAD